MIKRLLLILLVLLIPTLVLADGKPLIDMEGLNIPDLQGDVARSFVHNNWLVGAGVNVVSWKNLVTFRTEVLTDVESQSDEENRSVVVAGAFMLSFAGLADSIGGFTSDVLGVINPSLGAYGGWDMNNNDWDAGLLLTVIKVPTDRVFYGIGKATGISK